MKNLLLTAFLAVSNAVEVLNHDDRKLVLVTVATEDNDGLQRFVRSAKHFDMEPVIVGLGEKWVGGNLRYDPGGAQKVKLLQTALAKYKYEQNTVLLFTDAYDVIFQGGRDEILKKFDQIGGRVVISAEDLLWPDLTLESRFPETDGKRFLCSGGIIGYAPEIVSMVLNRQDLKDDDDDQLYYTHIYLDENLRNKWSIKLDHYAVLFQNMNGATEEMQLAENHLENIKFKTRPPVLHGNGPAKLSVNWFSNYVPAQHVVDRTTKSEKSVTLALFFEYPTPFIFEFLEKTEKIIKNYGAQNCKIWIRNSQKHHAPIINSFIERMGDFIDGIIVSDSIILAGSSKTQTPGDSRLEALKWHQEQKTDYIFMLDSFVQLNDETALSELVSVSENNSEIRVIAPLVSQWGAAWSNFWGALSNDGWYARSQDYMNILNGDVDGVFNAPYITNAILMEKSAVDEFLVKAWSPFSYGQLEFDMSFCFRLREHGIFMYILSKAANLEKDLLSPSEENNHQVHFGRVLVLTNTKTDKKHPDLWEIIDNPRDWEEKYINPQLLEIISEKATDKLTRPCSEVISFPFVTELFGSDLIEEMEANGEWSGAAHNDKRITGGYENVPTDDIHMNQIGWEKEWKHAVFKYMKPLVELEFTGYGTKCESHMMFVVRYHKGGQTFLRPHHDASTWSLTVALNKRNVDFVGGGTYFTRQKCLASPDNTGNGFIFPGRLTHQHAGQELKSGRRYIIVSFMDP